MKPDALARVVVLLLRSRPYRGLLVVSVLAAMVAIATSTGLAALRLSPQQAAVAFFGATQAYVQPDDPPTARPGQEIEDHRFVAELDDRVQVIRHATAWPSLQDASGGFGTTSFSEVALPSPMFEGNLDLIEGRWPQRPGECVATADLPDRTRPPLGSWELTVVGRVTNVFHADRAEIICAPGTWARWEMTPEERYLTSDIALFDYYLVGDPPEVRQVVASLIQRGLMTPDQAWPRDETERPTSASRFLSDQVPMAMIPLLLAAVLGGLVARWGGAVARALERAGVPRRPLRLAVLAGAVLGSALAALAGALIGSVAGFGLRPMLAAWQPEQPLSPWRLLAGEVVVVTVVTALGAAAGGWLGDAFRSRRLRQLDAPARPLPRGAALVLLVLAAALGGASVWLVLTSNERTWPMVQGLLAMVLAAGSLAPVASGLLGRGLARGRVSARTLAGRVVADDALRWGIVSGVVTIFLAVVIGSFLMSSASVAGLQKALASQVPPGMVVLEVTNPTGARIPAQVQQRFERDLGVGDPVRLAQRDVVAYPNNGMVEFFDSVPDAEQVLGKLTAEAVATLDAGGVLVVGGLQGDTATVQIDDSFLVEVPVGAIKPDPAHRLRTGFGFGVLPAMRPEVQSARPVRDLLIYQGLSPEQDALALNWADTTGFNVFQIDAYRPDDPIGVSAGIATGLAGFGLLAAPLLVGVLRREVNELRPLAATLRGVGLPATWIRPAFATTVLIAVLPAAALAVAGPTLAVAILARVYPAAFDLPGVPWWALAAFVAGVVGACWLATGLALRSLHRRERPVTV